MMIHMIADIVRENDSQVVILINYYFFFFTGAQWGAQW